jgi:hypothetical protein
MHIFQNYNANILTKKIHVIAENTFFLVFSINPKYSQCFKIISNSFLCG